MSRAPRSFREFFVVFSLGALATREASTSARLRSLRWSAGFLALSALVAVLILEHIHQGELADLIGVRVVAYASWLFGGLGLSALLKTPPTSTPWLARLRGRELRHIGVRSLGIMLTLSAGLALAALPSFLLSMFLAKSAPSLLVRFGQCLGLGLYCLFLGGSLGLIGEFSERAAPRSPRTVAFLLVVFPYLFAMVTPGIPSLPGACALWLNTVSGWGGPS